MAKIKWLLSQVIQIQIQIQKYFIVRKKINEHLSLLTLPALPLIDLVNNLNG